MPHPTAIKLRTQSKLFVISFDDGSSYELPFEYLRVYSPSAEVRGHGPGQEVLQLGKHNVVIKKVEPTGHYALRLIFDDGHDSGLYTWEYLQELGRTHEQKWNAYLDRLKDLGVAYPTVVPDKLK
jgi:DUF971 family protein